MNIQDAIRKSSYEIRREQTHVACEADQIHFVLVEHSGDLAIINFAFEAFGRNDACSNATYLGAIDSWRSLAIADNDGDSRVRNAPRRHGFRQSFEVRAAPA